MGDRARIERLRIGAAADRLDQLPGRLPGPAYLPVQIYDRGKGTYPTDAMQYFAAHPVTGISGQETAGGSGQITVDTSRTVYVLAIGPTRSDAGAQVGGGPSLPAPGDYVIAREVGGRWVADDFHRAKAAPGNCRCTCIPRRLVLDCDAPTLISGADAIPAQFQSVPYPITLEWGTPPVRSLAIPASGQSGGNQGIIGVSTGTGSFLYVALPDQTWFSKPFAVGNGFQYALWAYVSGCVMYIALVLVATITLPLNDGTTATYDGLFFPDPGFIIVAGFGGFLATCDPFDIEGFTWGTGDSTGGTDHLFMTGDSAYYYPYNGCVPLDASNSAGVGAIRSIPGGGSGYVGGGGGGSYGGFNGLG